MVTNNTVNRIELISYMGAMPEMRFTTNASLLCCWRLCCPDTPLYQRGAARQKNAREPTTAPRGNPRGRRPRRCAF